MGKELSANGSHRETSRSKQVDQSPKPKGMKPRCQSGKWPALGYPFTPGTGVVWGKGGQFTYDAVGHGEKDTSDRETLQKGGAEPKNWDDTIIIGLVKNKGPRVHDTNTYPCSAICVLRRTSRSQALSFLLLRSTGRFRVRESPPIGVWYENRDDDGDDDDEQVCEDRCLFRAP